MKNFRINISTLPLLLFTTQILFAQDSTRTQTYLQSSLATSYSAQNNWQGQDYKNLSFAGSVNYRFASKRANWNQQHLLLADLSYLKFIDSLWMKNTDRINLNLLWNEERGKILHSYSVIFQSQFLPTYTYSYDHEKRMNVKTKTAYTLNPSSLDLGYGAVFNFWKGSNINFAFATARFTVLPLATSAAIAEQPHFAKTEHSVLNINYGFSIATNIRKRISDRVEWWNNTRIFCNATDKEHVNFDFVNRINVKLWKYLQLRFDTKLAYNPAMNFQLQFGQEVLLGIFFEKQN